MKGKKILEWNIKDKLYTNQNVEIIKNNNKYIQVISKQNTSTPGIWFVMGQKLYKKKKYLLKVNALTNRPLSAFINVLDISPSRDSLSRKRLLPNFSYIMGKDTKDSIKLINLELDRDCEVDIGILFIKPPIINDIMYIKRFVLYEIHVFFVLSYL